MKNEQKTEALRQTLIEAFRNARKVVIGKRLFIGSTAEVEPRIERALARGQHVTEGGTIKWITFTVVFDGTRYGSAQYTWDASGNKVKVEKILVTDTKGEITKQSLGFIFKNFEEVV